MVLNYQFLNIYFGRNIVGLLLILKRQPITPNTVSKPPEAEINKCFP